MSPPNYAIVFDIIKQRKEAEALAKTQGAKPRRPAPPHLNPATNQHFRKVKAPLTATEILKYICWIVNADKLYKIALGTYDLGIVLLVAQ